MTKTLGNWELKFYRCDCGALVQQEFTLGSHFLGFSYELLGCAISINWYKEKL